MNTHLSIDLVNFDRAGLGGTIGKTLKCVSWPERQASECTWQLEIIWEGGTVWTVRSKPTMTESGHEMGALQIEESHESSLSPDFIRAIMPIDDFVLAGYRIASALENNVILDCAISLIDGGGRELVISTAPASGAVSLCRWGEPRPKTEFDPSSFVWGLEVTK